VIIQLMRVETTIVSYVLATSARAASAIVSRDVVQSEDPIVAQPISLATAEMVKADHWDGLPWGESPDDREVSAIVRAQEQDEAVK
jgi:hypothetical protein